MMQSTSLIAPGGMRIAVADLMLRCKMQVPVIGREAPMIGARTVSESYFLNARRDFARLAERGTPIGLSFAFVLAAQDARPAEIRILKD